jgi:NosR/NirI family nitrous oxide reductase transcriptional regulator
MINRFRTVTLILLGIFQTMALFAVQRFPKPEFESGYLHPQTVVPEPLSMLHSVMDVMVLLAALILVTWLVLKKRSRMGVFLVSLFSLLYFGFYREGCVCSIGSLQNISLALFNHGYAVSLTILAFFLLPLIFTLFFGRTFCAGVCPFGALQDLVAFRPQKLGTRLNAVLGLVPYIYLGLAVLYAATGTDFIICRYDPFVGIFRFNATFGMFIFAGLLLISGIFIARPYCRFLCPYGVLLNWVSRFSWRHLTITPADCIQCRLCEDSCPYDAIDIPLKHKNPETKQVRVRKFILISFMIPFLVGAGGFSGSLLSEKLAGIHPTIRLAKQVLEPVNDKILPESFEITAFRSSGRQPEQLFEEVKLILGGFYTGGWILGGFIGLVFGMLIAGRMLHRYQADYVPNKAACYSCGKCIDYCPVRS